jgi:NAD(P)H-dependent FMN reductase
MKKLFIPLVLGTAREGRVSEKVARYVFNEISTLGVFETQFVDVQDFLFGKTAEYPEIAKPWKEIMTRADGLIIVSPEYNRGIPGELKILIDSLDEEYAKKPVAIIGVSSGKWGGARMAEAILPTIITLGMVPISPSIPFPVAQNLFGADGKILDDSYQGKIASMVKEITWYAQVLKEAREK